MPRDPAKIVQIDVASPSQRQAALELALGSQGNPPPSSVIDRAAAEAQSAGEDWRGLLVARIAPDADDTPLVGAVWVRMLAGRVGSVTVPQTTPSTPPDTGAMLLQRAVDVAARCDSELLQALADPDDASAAESFVAAGFRRTTDLLFLVADCQSLADDEPDREIEWVEYSREQHRRLARVVERTYVDSRDCPELDGVRAIDDVLAGYRATGEFSPGRWLIAAQGMNDVGCLLLTDHPADDQWELVYLGIVPEFRGRGWGLAMTRRALQMARRAGRARLVLAVDAANAPAIAIYQRAGFETWERRAIYLRRFDKPREM